MQRPASLVLVPLVVLVSLTMETVAVDQYAVKDLHNSKAKEVMIKLQKEIDDLENSFEDFAEELQANNELLTSVKAYRKAYESAKHTECAGEEPPDSNDDDLIMSYIESCDESLPSGDMLAFTKKVKASKAKVKEIDDNLKKTCHSNPTSCEESTMEAEEQLDAVFTPELDAELKSDSNVILSTFKRKLDACFKRDSADLVDDLHEGVSAMNHCIAQLP